MLVAPLGNRAALASKFCWPGVASRPTAGTWATTPRGWEGSSIGVGRGFWGRADRAIFNSPAKYRCWRGRCLTDFGATGAGRGVWGSRRAKVGQPTCEQRVLCLDLADCVAPAAGALCGIEHNSPLFVGGEARQNHRRGRRSTVNFAGRPCQCRNGANCFSRGRLGRATHLPALCQGAFDQFTEAL